MGIINKTLLKSAKTPKRVYSIIKKTASQVVEFTLVEDKNIAKDTIEKELLLSAFVLDFNPNKDMRSNFILDYIKEIEDYFLSYNSSKDILYYFENSGCGACFGSKDADKEAKETLHDYIIARLILYRKIINDLHNGNNSRFDCLYYAIYHCSFSVCRYSMDKEIDSLKEDIIYSNHIIGEIYRKYKDTLYMLDKEYYNIVKMPKDTWITDYLDEEFHTEGELPYLKLNPGDSFTSFARINGDGILECCDCGYTQEIVAFLHGAYDATMGRQCPQCGTFCTEKNHSEEFHCFGPAKEDVVCPNCGYTIKKKEESILKGLSNPLFCPKCKGVNLLYNTKRELALIKEHEKRTLMYTPPFTISAEAINKIANISRLIERYDIRMEQEDAQMLRKANKIKTIYSSLAIVGNTLDEEQMRDIVNGKTVVAPIRQIQEVKNAIAAYEQFQHLDAFKESDLLRAHGIMMQALVDNAGQYRRGGVGVFSGSGCVHTTPPADRVPYLMADLFEWLKSSRDHLLVRSCVFHYEFEFIHPFADGNGRMGRLWQSLILSRLHPLFEHLPVENMVYANLEQYYDAITASSNAVDAGPFIDYMLGEIEKALEAHKREPIKKTLNKVTKKIPKKLLWAFPEMQSMAWSVYLQIAANGHLTTVQMAEALGISNRMVRKHINTLKAKGLITRVGSNKTGHWEAIKI